jgi:hypothetical protein
MLGKAVPEQAYYRPLGIHEVYAPRYRECAREGRNVVSRKHRPPLPRRRYSGYSFLLENESTPGPECGRKDYVNEYLNDPFRSRTCDPPASVLLPTAPLSAPRKEERPSYLCGCRTICGRGIGLIVNQVSLFFWSLKFAQIIRDSSVLTSQ